MKYNSLLIPFLGAAMLQTLEGQEPSENAEDVRITQTAGSEYYSNVVLSLGVGGALGLADPTLRQFSEARGLSETHSLSCSTYFYKWSGDQFSENNLEAIVDKLQPAIKRLEDKYGLKHYGSSFMSKPYAEGYKPDHMPSVSLSFSDPHNDQLTCICVILVFHTSPTILAINVTSALPALKKENKSEQATPRKPSD